MRGFHTGDVRRFVVERPYAVIAALALCGLFFPHFLRTSDWHNTYLPAGRALLAGEPYDPRTGYVYPPLPALLAVPPAMLPRWGAGIVFGLINVGAIALFWRWSWQLAGGSVSAKDDPQGRDGREHWVLLAGLACGLRFVTDGLDQQQTDLIIAAAMTGACMLLVADRWIAGAAVLGFAAAFKAVPLVWGLWFVMRRKWAAAVVLPAVMIGLAFLPDLILPAADGSSRARQWVELHLMPTVATDGLPAGMWACAPLFNQSLAGTLFRLVWLGPRFTDHGPESLDPLLFLGYNRIVKGLCVLLVAATAATLFRSRRSPDRGRTLLPYEFSLIFLLMVLISPASSKPHFVIVFLPALLLARRAFYAGDRAAAVFLTLAAVSGLLSNRILVGRTVGVASLWLGGVTWCAVLLFAGCLWTIWRSATADSAPPPASTPSPDADRRTPALSPGRVDARAIGPID